MANIGIESMPFRYRDWALKACGLLKPREGDSSRFNIESFYAHYGEGGDMCFGSKIVKW